MSDTTISFDKAAEERADPAARKLDRSTIEFSYGDIDDGVDIARAIYARAGLGSCEIDEIAAQLNQTVSGSFRNKVAAGRLFGFVEKDGRSRYRLSDLGRHLEINGGEQEARAIAFLNVPLHKEIFEKYRGHLLPPAKALEREMVALGVAPKQADKARHSFERSARQGGFFAQGEERLVQPRFDRIPETKPVEEIRDKNKNGGGRNGGGDGPGNLPRLVEALVESLPKDGETWTLEEASDWLQTAAYNFRYAYKLPGVFQVTINLIKPRTNETASD